MDTLSEKELSMLNDSLTEEELLVKKFQMLASQSSQDSELSNKFQQIAARHQKHFNDLYSLLG